MDQDRDERRKSIGAVVKALREANAMTRAELGAATASEGVRPVSVEMIAKIEQGVKAPSVTTLRRISAALKVAPADVLERSNAWQMGIAQGTSPALLRSVAAGATTSASVIPGMGSAVGPIVGIGVGAIIGRGNRAVSRSRIERALRERLAEFLETASDEAVADMVAKMGAQDLLQLAEATEEQPPEQAGLD